MPRGGYRGKTGLAQTQAARDKRKNHGLERYCLTLYLEPRQVEYLRGLESKQRSSVMCEALRVARPDL